MTKVLITGGHLTPALALIEELEKLKVEIYFIGRKHHLEGSRQKSPEYTILEDKVKFLSVTTGRLQRRLTLHTIPSLFKIPIGFIQSIIYLLKIKPDVVVSFGSYVSTPSVVAAWLLGIPTIVHEQASRVGLANSINAKFTKFFYSTWPTPTIAHAQVIGNLTRKSIFKKETKNKKINQILKSGEKLIYVTGASIGSHKINQVVFQALSKLKGYSIIHQLGTANFKNDHEVARKLENANYLPVTYLTDDEIGRVLNSAHIVVSRSGANTVWELAVLGKVSLLVPLPIAGASEQLYNAKILEKAGSALIIDQKSLNVETLINKIEEVESSFEELERSAREFSKTLKLDAAIFLKDQVLKLANHD